MRLSEVAQGFLHVREQPLGSNRSPEIDGWLRAVGAPLGSPWCAAALYAWLTAAGRQPPVRSGRVQDWVDKGTLFPIEVVQPDDVIVFWFESLHRYAHIAAAVSVNSQTVQTCEGNTIPTGFKGDTREGFGVFNRTLHFSNKLKVLRW